MTDLLKLGLTLFAIGGLGTLVMGFLDYEKVQNLFFLMFILGAVIMLVPAFILLWQS